MLSSNTGRLTPPKIEFRCTCGKRYRVPADKAGRKVRCKNCRLKVQVPGERQVSLRTRQAILEELGIDPEAAEHAYREEKRLEGYVCVVCDARIPEEALKAAYSTEGLVCEECRARQVQQRELGDPVENERKKKKKKLERWSSGVTPEEASKKARAYGALFLVGTAGLLWSLGLSFWLAAPAACAVAYAGARAVLRSELGPEVEAEDEED